MRPTKSQWLKFKKLLRIVLRSNRFYQKKLAKVGIKKASDIKTWHDFKKLPFTTREELLADQEKNPPFGNNLTFPLRDYLLLHETSGSSQQKTLFVPHSQQTLKRMTLFLPFFKKIGLSSDDRMFLFLPPALVYMESFVFNKINPLIICMTSSLTSLEEILKRIINFKITVFFGHLGMILDLTNLVMKKKIPASQLPIKKFITTGEGGSNLPSVRELIKKVWGVEIYDFIGSTEAGAIAMDCPQKSGAHLFTEHLLLAEVINPKTLKEVKRGELILTTLERPCFPLIRYKTNDFVQLDTAPCSCGSNSPRLKGGILYRLDKMVKIRGAAFYPDLMEKMIRKHQEVRDFLIILKTSRNGFDLIEIKVNFYRKKNKKIIEIIKKEFQDYTKITTNVSANSVFDKVLLGWKGKHFIDQRASSGLLGLNPKNWPSRIFTKIGRYVKKKLGRTDVL